MNHRPGEALSDQLAPAGGDPKDPREQGAKAAGAFHRPLPPRKGPFLFGGGMLNLLTFRRTTGLLQDRTRGKAAWSGTESGAAPVGHRPAPGVKIEASGVRKHFTVRCKGADSPQLLALNDVDLDIRQGEFLALVGPSGCGKSTFLDIVAGLATASGGSVAIDGRRVDGPGLDRGVVFQGYALFPWRTVQENVEFGLEVQAIPRGRRRETARQHLALVGLEGFEDRYPYQLSGGMRQRVAIARALAFNPEILLMDEPFGALDTQTRERLQLELLRIKHETRKTVLFVTHSIDEAVLLADRVAVMTSRPGTIKAVIDVRLKGARQDEDIRTTPEFTAVHNEIWRTLHGEVVKAEDQEYRR
jgi:NitT/TauT family transport system ATP-binding protein